MRLPALLLVLATAAALPFTSRAAEDVAEARFANDRFVAGGSVRQSKPVEGDLFGVGGNFDLAAVVGGDAVLGGGDLRIRERVDQDLYAGGGSVRVESGVGHNARLAGGNVEVTPQGSIGGNLSVAGGTIEIRGPVGGYVQAAGGSVLVDAAVEGDVTVASGELELGPNARIGGRVLHRGSERIKRDPAAQVAGGVERGERLRSDARRSLRKASGVSGGWVWTLGLVALAALIAAAFPAGARRLGESLRGDPGMAFLLGFIALVCVPVAALLLMITIVGIPLALVLLLLYFLMLIVGYAAVAVVIGDAALARFRSADAARTGWRIGAAMLAMLVLALAGRIPLLGGLVIFVALLAGIGAIVLVLRSRTQAGAPA